MHALVIVDIQNDFCPGGRLAVEEGDAVVPVVNELSGAFDHVLLTQDWHPADHSSFASMHAGKRPFDTVEMAYGTQILWPDHCVQGTQGAAFHPGLDVSRAELIIRKGFRRDIDSYSVFFENDRATPTGLRGYLRERGIDTIYLVGLALDFCVAWSALDGRREGFAVKVIEDASKAIDTDGSLDEALRSMDKAGVEMITARDALVSRA